MAEERLHLNRAISLLTPLIDCIESNPDNTATDRRSLANGVELNEFGSIRTDHVALYRDRMALSSTTYDMHGHLKKATAQARARELTMDSADGEATENEDEEKDAGRGDGSRLSTTASVSVSSEDRSGGSSSGSSSVGLVGGGEDETL